MYENDYYRLMVETEDHMTGSCRIAVIALSATLFNLFDSISILSTQ